MGIIRRHLQHHPGTLMSIGALVFSIMDAVSYHRVWLGIGGFVMLGILCGAVWSLETGQDEGSEKLDRLVEIIGVISMAYGFVVWTATHPRPGV